MSNLIFWQTVGAVIVGNTLFALTVFTFWRVGRAEDGKMPRAPTWVYFVGLLAPAVVMLSAYLLPH